MARMPQIPAVEYGGTPAAPVERAPLGNPAEVGEGLDRVASAAEDIGNVVGQRAAAAQRVQAKISAQKQAIIDTTSAARDGLDFDQQLRTSAAQLRQQFADQPDKATDELVRRGRELADGMVKTASNSAVQLALSRRTGASLAEQAKAMGKWAELQTTRKAQNDMVGMVNQATRGAEDQFTPNQLTAYAEQRHVELDPLFDKLTGDSAKAKRHLDNEIAKSWANAASARDPIGTLKYLDAEGGFLVTSLSAEDRNHLRDKAQASLEGNGRQKRAKVLMDGIDQVGQAAQLFRDGKLTPGVVYDMSRANEQKKLAVSVDPNMDDSSRKLQLQDLDRQNETLRQLDIASRKQAGYAAMPDEKVRHATIKAYNAVFDNEEKSPEKTLEAIGEFRHGMMKAFADGDISRADFERMEKGLGLALPKAMASFAGRLGDPRSGGPFDFAWREPRYAGNQALADMFDSKGVFANATPKQQNAARMFYIEQLNEAAERGTDITAETSRAFALKAANFAVGKRGSK